jgi:hypothetical protein
MKSSAPEGLAVSAPLVTPDRRYIGPPCERSQKEDKHTFVCMFAYGDVHYFVLSHGFAF